MKALTVYAAGGSLNSPAARRPVRVRQMSARCRSHQYLRNLRMTMPVFARPHRHSVQLSVRTRGIALTEKLHRVIRGSVSAAIGRFSRRVRGVFVWVEDTNGPKGGRGMQCKMEIRLKHGGRLTVGAEATNEYAAVGRAATRARIRLVRRINKRRARRDAPPAITAL